MLPETLELINFMGHKESYIDFTLFNSALIFAVNKNDPNISNGVGKSTIFKSIDYVLFDEYPAQADEIIRDGQPSCEVRFVFWIKNEKYKVIRGRSSKSGPYVNFFKWSGTWDSITQKTNTQTQAEILKIIKISYVSLKHSILFAQSDLDGIPFATSNKRKELLKEPLQLTRYTKYHKLAKKKLDETQKKLDFCELMIKELGDPTSELKEIDDKIEEETNKLKQFNLNKKQLEQQIDVYKNQLNDYQRMMGSDAIDINKKLSDVKKEKNDLNIDIKKIENEINSVKNKLITYKENLIKKLNSLQNKKDSLKKIESESLRDPVVIQKELDAILEKEKRGNLYVANLEVKKQQYEKPIPENGECYHCFQPIMDHVACVQKANKLLSQVLSDLDKYKDLLNKCQLRIKELYEEKRLTISKLASVDSLKLDISSWENNVRTDQESIAQFEQVLETKDNFLQKLITNRKKLEKQENYLIELVDKTNVSDLNNKINNVKNNLNSIQKELNQCISNISSSDTMLGVLQEKKDKKNQDIIKLKDLNSQKEDLKKIIILQTHAVKAFGPNGIPSLIINTVLDDLQIEVNNILSEIRPNIQCLFVLDEKTDNWDIVYYINNKERSQGLISGGQKVYIALSFKLALSRVIQRRLDVDLKFLELDEVDQPLDKAGLDAFAKIIRNWESTYKILIITHNEYLKTKFSHSIIVEGDDNNGSTAKVYTN